MLGAGQRVEIVVESFFQVYDIAYRIDGTLHEFTLPYQFLALLDHTIGVLGDGPIPLFPASLGLGRRRFLEFDESVGMGCQ